MRTECPSVMYSQVLKYELNEIYHFIEAMLHYLTLFLNAVYFCAFLFLCNFLFKLKT